jgi:chemotaxis protein MotB
VRPRRTAQCTAGHTERWLVSYADFITLLLAFFVTMYAISNVDKQKLSQAVEAFHEAFEGPRPPQPAGMLPATARIAPRLVEPVGADRRLVDVATRLFYRMRAIGEDRVELTRDHRGLVITVREAGTFDTGRADLSPSAQALFAEIARSLADLPNAIRVEGHTDDVPIHTGRFASNWELSTARATAVIAFLSGQEGIRPDRLSAAGYGEFHPRVPNDSVEHRARNRRVDIVVLNTQTETLEEPLVGLDRRR